MLKKTFAVIFLLLFLSGIVFFLYHFRSTKRPVNSAIHAIPTSAAFIIETKQTHDSWKKLSETNIIWEELLNVKFVSRLDSQVKIFDSLYVLNPLVKELFDKESLFISAHITDERNFNFIFLFNIPPSIGSRIIYDLSKEISPGYSQTEKEYDGATISTLSLPPQGGVRAFSFSVYNDIFIGSFNTMLVEDAIRQINKGASLQDDFAFNRVVSTSGEKADVNFYFNHKFFPKIITSFTKNEYSPSLLSLENFADWTALDLKIKPNLLMLNGFTFTNDSLNKFLNFFKGQKPQEPEFTDIIPANTAAFIHFGFSNFSAFYRELNAHPDNNERDKKINLINKECLCDIEKDILSWVENEMAILITQTFPGGFSGPITEEQYQENPPGNYFAVFKSGNIEEAKHLLAPFADSANDNKADTNSMIYEIKKVRFQGIFPLLMGNLFSDIQPGYFAIIEDFVVFSNDNISLRDFVSHYISGKTFSKKVNYNSFSENLSSESNIFIYADIDRSFNILGRFLNKDYLKDMEENQYLFRKFESVAIQFSNENNDLFYNNIFIKYNPVYKQEATTLWETRLDSPVYSIPFLVTNHYTQTKEIFVQDHANKIYLVSGTGKILWKRQLPEKIMGGVTQVDALKNNKLQMIFNTSSFIFLIDRNGKDVTGFPVKLKAPATNEISVVDYEKNKNYRMLVACNDGLVYNFEINGKPVKGWEFQKLKTPMKQPLKYFVLDGKDYLVGIDEGGNIYITDRSGQSRIQVKGKILLSKNNSFFIEPGKSINKTRIVSTDSSGTIIRLYLNGNTENIKIDDFSDQHFFSYKDINNDKSPEYIFVDKNKLKVYSQDKLRYSILDYQFEAGISHQPLFFEFPDNSIRIGITDKETGKIYLFNESGNQEENFPLSGNTLFSIGNLNIDREIYLVTGTGNNIYTYLLK